MSARVLLAGLLLAAVAGPAAFAAPPPPAVATADAEAASEAAGLPEAVEAAPEDLKAYFLAQPRHLRGLFEEKVEAGLIGGPEHVRRLLSLRLSGQDLELLLSDNCILCHSNPDQQVEETLFTFEPEGEAARAHLDLRAFTDDVHFRRGLSCSGCHGGAPTDEEMSEAIYARWPDAETRRADRSWIPGFCARCHADPQRMREYAPGLPTDQLAKYRTSRHGRLLLEAHDSKAAQCVSCHGVHGIQGPENPTSRVHPTNIPKTCGACHADPGYMAGYTVDGRPIPTDQVAQYEKSVHGRALLEKHDLGAPVCNDCHGNHAAMPPGVSQVALVCRNCHGAEANYFDASRHEVVFEANGWPQCVQCHGKHDIEHPTEAMLANTEGTVCYDCHQVHAPDNETCNTMPTYMRRRILGLESAVTGYEAASERLAERGLDVEPLEASVSEISDALKGSRTRVHAFDRSTFDEAADQGRKASDDAEAVVDRLHREYRFRTTGLLVSVGVMGVLALGLYLRVRTLGRRR